MRREALAFALVALVGAARAQDARPPRLIAPDRFPPSFREPGSVPQSHAAIVMPTPERPVGACDREARDWLACLEATARLSDGAVDEEEARLVDSLDRRTRLNLVMRASTKKALKSAEESWRALRDLECGDLVLIERDLGVAVREARLICRIRRNLERAQTLATRYGEGP